MKKFWNYLQHIVYRPSFFCTFVPDMYMTARHLTMIADNSGKDMSDHEVIGIRLSEPSILDGPEWCYLQEIVNQAWTCGYDPLLLMFPNGKAIAVPFNYRQAAAMRYGVRLNPTHTSFIY